MSEEVKRHISVDISEVLEMANEYGFELKDRNLLESALAAPFHGVFDRELFPNIWEKAAILFRSIVKNHAFVDGNKRIGIKTLLRFLELNGYSVPIKEHNTLRLLALLLASGATFNGDEEGKVKVSFDTDSEEMKALIQWFKDHIEKRKKIKI